MNITPRAINYMCQHTGNNYDVDIYSPLELVKYLHQSDNALCQKFVVNIGAADGMTGDPCFPIYSEGWPGLAIEGGDNKAIFDNLPQENVTKLTNQFCTPLNIADLLRSGGTPIDFSFLKIDIDGYDGPVLQAVLQAGFRPAIICAEICNEIPFPYEFSVMYSEEYIPPSTSLQGGFHGMSFAYAARLAQAYGYHFVSASNEFLSDAIFLRDDLASLFGSKVRTEYDALKEIYFSHPAKPLSLSYFRRQNPEAPLIWRRRKDYQALARDLFSALSMECGVKHGGRLLPFYFGMHPHTPAGHEEPAA